jgi:hypothetical protein
MNEARDKSRPHSRFTKRLLVRCPASLPLAIDRAAAKNLMTSSEYVRRSVIARLEADGVDLAHVAESSKHCPNS